MLARVTATVINILITVLSSKSWLTVTLICTKVINASRIRMTGVVSFTFINILRTCWTSIAGSSTVTSKVVNTINTRTLATWMYCTVVYVCIASLPFKTFQKTVLKYYIKYSRITVNNYIIMLQFKFYFWFNLYFPFSVSLPFKSKTE